MGKANFFVYLQIIKLTTCKTIFNAENEIEKRIKLSYSRNNSSICLLSGATEMSDYAQNTAKQNSQTR
jgi:hypothetical protein